MAQLGLIVNPRATRVDDARVAAVEQALRRVGELETRVTERRGHATELARELAPNVDALFVFSGDGGFNEVANGLGLGAPPLGCIPGGGTSVFPRALGLPREPVRAANVLVDAFERERVRRISLGRVNGRRFLFNAGLLLDAELVRRVEERRSRTGRPGDVAFALTLLKLVTERRGRFQPLIEVEDVGRVAFLLVANTDPYTYLGAVPVHVAPDAAFERGLSALAPARTTPLSILGLLSFVLTGRGRARVIDDLDRIVARADAPLPLQADGEDLGDVTDVVFESERQALAVLH